ncbi:MAG: cobalamin-binding protein [Pirellulales bacterium]
MRIVSLLPAATEIVSLLDRAEDLVGVSHACDYPACVESLPKLTSSQCAPAEQSASSSARIDASVRELSAAGLPLFAVDAEALRALQPDIIITQSLCDVCAVSPQDVRSAVAQMRRAPQIVELHPTNLSDVFQSIREVAEALACSPSADKKIAQLRSRVERVREIASRQSLQPTVVLLEWIDPFFSAGHWNPELIESAGGRSVLGRAGEKSRQIEWEDIAAVDPDVLFIACCGYSIDQTMEDLPKLVGCRGFGKLRCIEGGGVFLADGSQYFNRPGPRLIDSLEILADALHPGSIELSPDIERAVRLKREPKR